MSPFNIERLFRILPAESICQRIVQKFSARQAMREAGVPPGVVNFVPADGPTFGTTITQSIHLSGINFTGSARAFQWLWQEVGKNVANYRNFPRLVGECGGKNYHFVHKSAHIDTVVATTLRSAFEYSGQKCSACSRMYVASSIWPQIKSKMLEIRKTLQVGDPTNFTNFTGAVINGTAFERIVGFIENAKKSKTMEILGGGCFDRSKGYFVEPTIIQTQDPLDRTMTEEIFGPVLTVYVYEDEHVEEALKLVGATTKFALTGAIFAQDQEFLKRALEEFRMTAGNLYLNDKSTGAVVGQQPFGGGRMSGTNDKAGGPHYILKWTTPQVIKETFTPQLDVFYPSMQE